MIENNATNQKKGYNYGIRLNDKRTNGTTDDK